MKAKTYIAFYHLSDEYVTRRLLINYINVGKKGELRFPDLSVKNPKSLRECIVYLEDEIKALKINHPEAIIIPYSKSTTLDFLSIKKGKLRFNSQENQWYVWEYDKLFSSNKLPLLCENNDNFYYEQKVSVDIVYIDDENGVAKPYAKLITENDNDESKKN